VIVALTPNLALDRTLGFATPLRLHALNRVAELREAAGGKGVNLARAVRALGGEVAVAGFVAGYSGRKFRRLLAEEGLGGILEEVSGETRACHILLDGSPQPTELNEMGPPVPPEAWRALVQRLPEGQLVICGSFPPQSEALLPLLEDLPAGFVVDSSGPALNASLGRASLIAPNKLELAALCGKEAGVSEALELYATSGTRVLLTLGAAGAVLVGERALYAPAPAVDTNNPVGSGDCLLGAFLWAKGAGLDDATALAYGVAAGSDNARRGGGGRVSREGIEELKDVPVEDITP
jgi:tagatose 6-phosphate kinase